MFGKIAEYKMNPQTIADGVLALVSMTDGTRPLRYPLDAVAEGTPTLNSSRQEPRSKRSGWLNTRPDPAPAYPGIILFFFSPTNSASWISRKPVCGQQHVPHSSDDVEIFADAVRPHIKKTRTFRLCFLHLLLMICWTKPYAIWPRVADREVFQRHLQSACFRKP
jgi:hypothetical protein